MKISSSRFIVDSVWPKILSYGCALTLGGILIVECFDALAVEGYKKLKICNYSLPIGLTFVKNQYYEKKILSPTMSWSSSNRTGKNPDTKPRGTAANASSVAVGVYNTGSKCGNVQLY